MTANYAHVLSKGEMIDMIMKHEKRITALEAALTPFSDAYSSSDPYAEITLADLRLAHDAIRNVASISNSGGDPLEDLRFCNPGTAFTVPSSGNGGGVREEKP